MVAGTGIEPANLVMSQASAPSRVARDQEKWCGTRDSHSHDPLGRRRCWCITSVPQRNWWSHRESHPDLHNAIVPCSCYTMTPRLEPAAGNAPALPLYQSGVLLLPPCRPNWPAKPYPSRRRLEPRVGLAPTSQVYETRASLSTLAGHDTWRPPSDSHRVRSGLQPDASTTSAWQSETGEQRWDLHPHRLLHREKCC